MNVIGILTLTEREVTRVLRIWTQTIIPPVITALLFILIFGLSLGSRISSVGGVGYLQYIIPGLLMMGMIMSAYSNTTSSLYLAKFQGSVQEMMVARLSYWGIIMALTLGGLIRALLVGTCILLVSLLFAHAALHSVVALIYFAVMSSLLFSFAGIVTALWATNFDRMNIFITFLITPLTYLGGVFYSITMLPPIWQTIARFNPILYIVDGFRYAFIGSSDVPILYSFLVVLVLTIFFFFLCVHLFRIGYRLRT